MRRYDSIFFDLQFSVVNVKVFKYLKMEMEKYQRQTFGWPNGFFKFLWEPVLHSFALQILLIYLIEIWIAFEYPWKGNLNHFKAYSVLLYICS